jgi:hypothetical protein
METDRLAVEQFEVFGYERARKAAPAGRSARSVNQSATREGVVFFPEACPPLWPVAFPSTLLGGRDTACSVKGKRKQKAGRGRHARRRAAGAHG